MAIFLLLPNPPSYKFTFVLCLSLSLHSNRPNSRLIPWLTSSSSVLILFGTLTIFSYLSLSSLYNFPNSQTSESVDSYVRRVFPGYKPSVHGPPVFILARILSRRYCFHCMKLDYTVRHRRCSVCLCTWYCVSSINHLILIITYAFLFSSLPPVSVAIGLFTNTSANLSSPNS